MGSRRRVFRRRLDAADHVGDHLFPRHLLCRIVASDDPVAHDDDTVGDREDLRQAVGNEDDGNAASSQRTEPREEVERLVLG
jgi:hypothetical protein